MSETINVLITTLGSFGFTEEQLDKLRGISPSLSIEVVDPKKVTDEMMRKAEVIFGWLDKDKLKEAAHLKWLQLPSAGADGYTDRSSYAHGNVVVTNSSGVFGLPIAEHVFSLILAFNRNLHIYADQKSKRKWKSSGARKDFYGSTLGVIGLGDIGSQVAERAHVWGARVLAVKRTPSQKPDYVDELYGEEGIDQLLAQSDYIVLALPNTSKTEGIINEERLRLMKPDAFIVNVGRGAALDQEALIKVLREGRIGGAGLDVTTPEPLPEDDPLWDLPNVILTPHSSGSSPTNSTRRFQIFGENLKRYVEGRELTNLVSFKEGY